MSLLLSIQVVFIILRVGSILYPQAAKLFFYPTDSYMPKHCMKKKTLDL